MKRIRSLIAGIGLAVTLTTPALAQELKTEVQPQSLAKAERLVEVSAPAEMVEQMMMAMTPMMEQQMTAAFAEEGRDVPEGFVEDFMEIVTDESAYITQTMIEGMTPIYAEIFTEEEMDAMIALYESEAGKSAMAKMPQVAMASMELMQEDMMDMQMRMMGRMMELMEKYELEQ